jgi:hypothetical protein
MNFVKVWGTFPKVKPHTTSEQQSLEIKKGNSQDWSMFTGQNKYKRIFGLWKLGFPAGMPIPAIF